jgi:recombinational DNA repair protein (RecF pathway)
MYQKYQTEALVLSSREGGETDRILALFTRDFGLIHVRAFAVRLERSKMRYALQLYANAHVGLVRGKTSWRMAGARAIANSRGDGKSLGTFARISELVLRLVGGEEKNEYLFSALSDAHRALMSENCEAHATIEIVCVARVLYALGYISSEALETALFTHTAYGDPELSEAELLKDALLLSINRAISETQL